VAARLIWTKGLPASGKTTFARKVVAEHPGVLRINKDDLRDMLHGGKWTKDNERTVLQIRDIIIESALLDGRIVVVDDTNLEPKHEEAFRRITSGVGCEMACQDFTSVPLKTCLDRNLSLDRQRAGRVVPPSVILRMYNRHKLGEFRKHMTGAVRDESKPNVIICDIDGTVAWNNGHRGWFDEGEDQVYADAVRKDVADVVASLGANFGIEKVIFMSGRTERAREGTERWLTEKAKFNFAWDLHMRAIGDNREDSIVKREMYEAHVADRYNVVAVFDDRACVVRDLWSQLGLTVFRVGVIDEDEF
jgi:predicted kinase